MKKIFAAARGVVSIVIAFGSMGIAVVLIYLLYLLDGNLNVVDDSEYQ